MNTSCHFSEGPWIWDKVFRAAVGCSFSAMVTSWTTIGKWRNPAIICSPTWGCSWAWKKHPSHHDIKYKMKTEQQTKGGPLLSPKTGKSIKEASGCCSQSCQRGRGSEALRWTLLCCCFLASWSSQSSLSSFCLKVGYLPVLRAGHWNCCSHWTRAPSHPVKWVKNSW